MLTFVFSSRIDANLGLCAVLQAAISERQSLIRAATCDVELISCKFCCCVILLFIIYIEQRDQQEGDP